MHDGMCVHTFSLIKSLKEEMVERDALTPHSYNWVICLRLNISCTNVCDCLHTSVC